MIKNRKLGGYQIKISDDFDDEDREIVEMFYGKDKRIKISDDLIVCDNCNSEFLFRDLGSGNATVKYCQPCTNKIFKEVIS